VEEILTLHGHIVQGYMVPRGKDLNLWGTGVLPTMVRYYSKNLLS